jgi:arylsulfatase
MLLGDSAEQVVVDVAAPGGGVWDVSVLVDGQLAMRPTRVRQLAGFLPFEGIDVGIDRRSPVSWRLYEKHGAFPFTGGPLAVSYVPGERAPDAPERRLAQARAVGAGLQ